MLLLAAPAAATGFACQAPIHHDGDAIRCAGTGRSDRLFGIDAPEMPGACRPGRKCTPGDPFAARDHLARLTSGRDVTCEQRDSDVYGRRIVRCAADGIDLSCAMVADGFAVERYGRLDCDRGSVGTDNARSGPTLTETADAAMPTTRATSTPRNGDGDALQERRRPPDRPVASRSVAPVWLAGGAWLLFITVATYALFAIDKQRARSRAGRRRIPEQTLLLMAIAGGSIGAFAAQQRLHHKTAKQPFVTYLLWIGGFQIGAILAIWILLRQA